jgi:hypothetical protein
MQLASREMCKWLGCSKVQVQERPKRFFTSVCVGTPTLHEHWVTDRYSIQMGRLLEEIMSHPLRGSG